MENDENYPQQIEDRIPDNWGKYLSIHPDWYPLVSHLDMMIAGVAPDYTIHQVKEKFGGLRYYIDENTIPEEHKQYVRALVGFAESFSYKV